jgi:flagellar P-ring protein precursor FlgI
MSDTEATIVISENTGTIVAGGNVRLGPAMVAKGSLTVKIEQELIISQPNPFTFGNTVVGQQTNIKAEEEPAQVTMMGPTATVADLARIFQALRVSATDMIAILQALRSQGALKARIKIQ